MKRTILFAFLLSVGLISCRFENNIIEETYPDGSPKLVCIYLGRGQSRELIKQTAFYPNKQAQMEGTYKNNRREGHWIYWWMNGKVWSEGTYVNGKADGIRTVYFENGKVRQQGMYKEDMRVGKWRFFDENGRLLQELDYSATPKIK